MKLPAALLRNHCPVSYRKILEKNDEFDEEHRFDVNAKNIYGITALDIANDFLEDNENKKRIFFILKQYVNKKEKNE